MSGRKLSRLLGSLLLLAALFGGSVAADPAVSGHAQLVDIIWQ